MEKLKKQNNIDEEVIKDFGEEWNEYNHINYSSLENIKRFLDS